MAITFDYLSISELTITLNAGDKKYIDFNGIISTSTISINFLDTTGACVVRSAQESNAFVALPSTSDSDILWEYIKIGGVSTPSVTTNVYSQSFRTPSLLCVENTSLTSERVRISIRGNR